MLRSGSFTSAGAGVLGALWLAGVLVLAAAPGCAQGADDIGDPGGTGPGSGGGTGTGTPTTTGNTGAGGANPTTGGMGGGGAGSPCGPEEHMCGGICTGNTPASGCFSSNTCDPCETPANGTATCTTNGLCDFECPPPFQKSGTACTCPTQCCSNAQCTGGLTCMNGTCQCATECCSNQDCAPGQLCGGGSCACNMDECAAHCITMFMFPFCDPITQDCLCVQP